MRAYFELDAHPEPRMEYTARLDSAKIKRMLRLRSATEWGRGMGAQMVRARVNARIGATRNRRGEDEEGRTGSLINNFRPSAIGCKSP